MKKRIFSEKLDASLTATLCSVLRGRKDQTKNKNRKSTRISEEAILHSLRQLNSVFFATQSVCLIFL